MEPSAGMQIGPNLQLLRPLGQGGVGAVWVAEHNRLGTEVAVKFIDAAVADRDPAMLARFKREARTAAQIKSPHVVQMLDDGVLEDGTPYIVMELLRGESLEARLASQGALEPSQVDTLISQVAEALETAHRLHIIHRDLKPANLFLIESGYDLFVKVLDFGIAKVGGAEADNVTSTLSVIGTPRYMSPEQLLSSKDVGPSADLWALAVIVYVTLSGQLPFSGDTLAAITLAVCSSDYRPISEHAAKLPASLVAFFDRAFQQEPAARFGSAQELAKALREALQSAGADTTASAANSSQPSEAGGAVGPDDDSAAAHAAHEQPALPLAVAAASVEPTKAQAPVAATPAPVVVAASTEPTRLARSEAAPPPARSRGGLLIGLGVGLIAAMAAGAAWLGGIGEPTTAEFADASSRPVAAPTALPATTQQAAAPATSASAAGQPAPLTNTASALSGSRAGGVAPQPQPAAPQPAAQPATVAPAPTPTSHIKPANCSDPNAYKTDSRCPPPVRTTRPPSTPDCSNPNAYKTDSRCLPPRH